MPKLNEDAIEMMAVAALEKLGYHYFYSPDIAPDGKIRSAANLAKPCCPS